MLFIAAWQLGSGSDPEAHRGAARAGWRASSSAACAARSGSSPASRPRRRAPRPPPPPLPARGRAPDVMAGAARIRRACSPQRRADQPRRLDLRARPAPLSARGLPCAGRAVPAQGRGRARRRRGGAGARRGQPDSGRGAGRAAQAAHPRRGGRLQDEPRQRVAGALPAARACFPLRQPPCCARLQVLRVRAGCRLQSSSACFLHEAGSARALLSERAPGARGVRGDTHRAGGGRGRAGGRLRRWWRRACSRWCTAARPRASSWGTMRSSSRSTSRALRRRSTPSSGAASPRRAARAAPRAPGP